MVAPIELLQQDRKARLGFDGNTGRPQFQEDAYAIAHVRADVEDERAPIDELRIEAAVTAGAAGLAVVDQQGPRQPPQAPKLRGRIHFAASLSVRLRGCALIEVASGRRWLQLLEPFHPWGKRKEKVVTLFQFERCFLQLTVRKGALIGCEEDRGAAAPAAGVNCGEQTAQ